jgi:photosystem II stability/assembly factor-like uncharacterized protein
MLKRNVAALRCVLLLAIFLLLSSCPGWRSGAGKPSIAWRSYDYSDGLGNPLPAASRAFETLPIEQGLSCHDIRVGRTSSGEIIWAGTGGPLIYSTDQGASWTVDEESMEYAQNAEYIRYDRQGNLWVADRGCVYRSTDDGHSWERVADDYFAGLSECIGVAGMETQGDYVWVPCEGEQGIGRLLRIDILTLELREIYTPSERVTAVLPLEDGTLYVGTSTAIRVSHDGGVTLEAFHALESAQQTRYALAYVGGAVWCLYGYDVIRLSSSGAETWRLSEHYPVHAASFTTRGNVLWVCGDDAGKAVVLSVDTGSGNAVAVIDVNAQNPAVIYADDAGRIWMSLPGMISVTVDGGQNWTSTAIGVSSICSVAAEDGVVWTGFRGGNAVAQLRSGSGTWETTYLEGLTEVHAYIRTAEEVLFPGCSCNAILQTHDGGRTFENGAYEPFDQHRPEYSNYDVGEDASGTLYLAVIHCPYAGECQVLLYHSTDGGRSWGSRETVCSWPLQPGFPRIAMDPGRGRIWVGCSAGLYYCPINGSGWAKDSRVGQADNIYIDSAGNLYLLGEGPGGAWGLHVLKAGADDWETVPLMEVSLAHCSFEVDSEGGYWFASREGLFYSPMGGATWFHYTKQDGMASNYINSLDVEESAGQKKIWLGTALGVSVGTVENP